MDGSSNCRKSFKKTKIERAMIAAVGKKNRKLEKANT